MTRRFYALLERFLKIGPVGDQTNKVKKSISVYTLELDVHMPDVSVEMIRPKPEPRKRGYDALVRQRKANAYMKRRELGCQF